MFSILLLAAVGCACLAGAVAALVASLYEKGRRRWVSSGGSLLLLAGMIGFFGNALSGLGGLNWLPPSFEWPVGYSSGVVTTEEGLHVVPHTSANRVQVYDPGWRFLRGWHVDAHGGTFKLNTSPPDRIHVITARGQRHFVYDAAGRLLSKEKYSPRSYASFANQGQAQWVPTSPWLWVFSSPLASGAVAAVGMIALVSCRERKRA